MEDFFNDYLQSVLKWVKELENATLIVNAYMQGAADAQEAQKKGNAFTAPSSTDSTKEQKIRGSYILPERKTSNWSVLTLTEKEILRMPKQFRKQFRVGRVIAHVRKKDNGVYEVQCQINKTKIYASSKVLAIAKEKFTDALIEYAAGLGRTPKNVTVNAPNAPVTPVAEPVAPPPVTLGEYMLKWLETVKKPIIKENTYMLYFGCYYKANINPALGNKVISDIKPFELQEFFNNLISDGKVATAKQSKILLKAMFEYAVIDGIITKSPMDKVTTPHYESEKGIPLTREEEKALVNRLLNGGNVYVQSYVFMLYTGLRRSELASVEIKDGWINLISAKGRKGYRVKSRSVPISPMLAPLLQFIDIGSIKNVNIGTLTEYGIEYLNKHHTHELRHTFITRCQECGIKREIVSLWAGHKADNSITATIYTHLEHNKNIQLEEINKFKYEL